MKKSKITSNEELRGELINVFNDLVNGDADLREVRAKVSAAGTILQSAALQMKYQDLRGEKPQVEFLES
jgi:hypothetical protein